VPVWGSVKFAWLFERSASTAVPEGLTASVRRSYRSKVDVPKEFVWRNVTLNPKMPLLQRELGDRHLHSQSATPSESGKLRQEPKANPIQQRGCRRRMALVARLGQGRCCVCICVTQLLVGWTG